MEACVIIGCDEIRQTTGEIYTFVKLQQKIIDQLIQRELTFSTTTTKQICNRHYPPPDPSKRTKNRGNTIPTLNLPDPVVQAIPEPVVAPNLVTRARVVITDAHRAADENEIQIQTLQEIVQNDYTERTTSENTSTNIVYDEAAKKKNFQELKKSMGACSDGIDGITKLSRKDYDHFKFEWEKDDQTYKSVSVDEKMEIRISLDTGSAIIVISKVLTVPELANLLKHVDATDDIRYFQRQS